jgi:ABC-type arginine transport system permease subunit
MGAVIVAVAVAAVALILAAGIYTLWAGGQVSRDWSNKLMRYRILAQAIALVIIMTVLYFGSQH